ncbi:TonB-dependent receptor [Parahaliea aestuarii]|uniref:TonB-dependent receptor n=1 Tax=Parahaliea aestuarii TaxID=1852021 RepID=A0A5C8ZLM3_9GAMM|nr:TonB-dependent receptor [Parahaliea aestuarii]TXS89358.1 TonB-dependent receptor [Parahaliea aestuarii]
MKRIAHPPLLGTASLAVAVITASGQVQAQQRQVALEEVVVTAQKREQNLQDVPLAVQALNADALRQNGIDSLSDISDISPGVKIADTQGAFSTAAVRGVSSFAFGFGLEESVPFYLDGVYLGNGSAMLGDLLDVQQVEVLKGPQGTLFGRNASGGAINVRTNRPGNEVEASVSVGAGNYDLRTVQTLFNAPLIEDKLLMRGGFSTRDRDGWQTNVVTGRKDGFAQDRWSGYVKALWLASDAVELEFSSDWSEQDDHIGYENANAINPLATWLAVYDQANPESFFDEKNNDFASGNNGLSLDMGGFTVPIIPADAVDPAQKRKIRGNSLKVTWDINSALMLTSVSSYRQTDTAQAVDADGSDLGLVNTSSSGSTEEYNQEIRLNYSSNAIDWFAGVNAYRQDRSATGYAFASSIVSLGRLGLAGLGSNVSESSAGSNKTESYAAFGDATWHVSNNLNLTAGLRYSYDAKSYRREDTGNDTFNGGGILFPNLDQLADPDMQAVHDNWSNISGRVAVDYHLTDDTMLYASVSQGYKSGGFNTTLTVESTDAGFITPAYASEPFDEETNINYEIGLKSKLLDGRLRLDSSIFQYIYKDLQILMGDSSSPVSRTINASEVTGRGWETDLTFLATERLSLNLNLSLLNAEYSDDVYDAQGTKRVAKGTERPWAPEVSALIGINYEVPLADIGSLRTNLNYSYTDDHYQRSPSLVESLPDSANRQEAYSILNGRISFYTPAENWEVAVWGKNLLDERYRSFINGSALSLGGVLQAVIAEPRTFGIEASYHY